MRRCSKNCKWFFLISGITILNICCERSSFNGARGCIYLVAIDAALQPGVSTVELFAISRWFPLTSLHTKISLCRLVRIGEKTTPETLLAVHC
jgi:hypothetical protein